MTRGHTTVADSELSLLTDLYQLTMACGYWRLGHADREAVFHLSFRDNPFGGGYTVAAGLEYVTEFLAHFQFQDADLAYLAGLTGNDQTPLFDETFLEYLRDLRLTCDVDAVPEGTVVFPHEPLVRVRGPVLQGQLLETALLNMINFQTLVATKSARICTAAGDDPVIEFGLRRAQGIDGALAASRAAYIGGCAATSNLLAGKRFNIPVRGTHAHSWVLLFDDEVSAFENYARVMPNNCIFLVDTYDTISGVRNAITVGQRLKDSGHRLAGIRLDSGDLAYLSIEARRLLDEAGFHDAVIVASNDLDEHIISSVRNQGSRIGVWGVGTRLATAYDQPALGGVFKMSAVRSPGGQWQRKVKLSNQVVKTSIPGILQCRRFSRDDAFIADMIYDELIGPAEEPVIIDPVDATRRMRLPSGLEQEELLVPVVRNGRLIYAPPPLAAVRDRTRQQLARLHPAIKRFLNPHDFPAGLEQHLHQLRTQLILDARGVLNHGNGD